MTIRTRLLVVAMVPAAALVAVAVLPRSAGQPLALGVAAGGAVMGACLALAVARSITTPLHRLGEAAERASHLPALVEALRRPSGHDQDLALAPVGLAPGSEIGDVAHTFDTFQGAAARMAVAQAALLNKTVAEKGTIEVFVNLARRMQGLVDHQIEFLDGLEAEEQDPDALDNLFRLDQLATRVRRNAESLLTLAGAASARSWERPLAMSDVIRAGMAEVEDIGRVDLMLDDHAAMLGNVAADAAHLLSELMENATRWSPPDTRVQVTGSPAAGGYAITIEDRGVGMSVDALAEANHILSGPPLAEATVARSLGLVVAGRLARRLGVVVRLAASGAGGVVAKVLVPPALMMATDEAMDLEDAGAGSGRALPFALARQEKRARISSQRSRSRRPAGPVGEATITRLPEPRWTEPAPEAAPEPAAPPAAPEQAWAPAPVVPEPAWIESSPAPAETPTEADWWVDPPPAAVPEPASSEAEMDRWPADAGAGDGGSPADPPAGPMEVADPVVFEEFLVEDAGPEPAWTEGPLVHTFDDESSEADLGWAISSPVTEAAPPPPAVSPLPAVYAEAAMPDFPADQPMTPVPAVQAEAPMPVVDMPAPAVQAEAAMPAFDMPVPAVQAEAAMPAFDMPAPEPPRLPSPQSLVQRPPASGAALPTRGPVTGPARGSELPRVRPAPAEPPSAIRPVPSVRPARFSGASSKSLADAGQAHTPDPIAEAKEDEYRRHLERATAAGLVRRVPKASLPQDTGGGALRTPTVSAGQPVPDRLPDEVRSLLSNYRSGVQRGRADGPSDEEWPTTPEEQA